MVASNPEEKAQQVTKKAFASYASKSDVKGTVTIISELKGIGPATASLILAVHDPENVMFFSDEAYHWLCASESETAPDLKYNAKEYEELHAKANALMTRLKVSPIDVEKVAYVLMRENEPASITKKSAGRPKGRASLSEELKKSGSPAGRPRGRPKAAPKSEASEEEPEQVKKTPIPNSRPRGRPKSAPKSEVSEEQPLEEVKKRGRPKSVPKPDSSESNKPAKTIAKDTSPTESKSPARNTKRKADNDLAEVNKPALKRGRPKGKSG